MWFDFCNIATSRERIEFNREIAKLRYWFAKISAPTFRNLPDKLSMPTALDGFKPIDGLDGFKYLIFFQEIFQKIQNLIH